jgi:hypothetical protein
MNTKQAEIQNVLNKHGLTIEAVFVPFSQSRNAGEKSPSLNWKVTLKHNGRKVLTTDYMAGCAHAPSYKQSFRHDVVNEKVVAMECEKGRECRWSDMRGAYIVGKETINPDSVSVIYSLLMDAEVLDYGGFEDWADSFGYDADSRQAERTYNDCMKIALQLRTTGESVVAELREAYQDY